MDGIIVKLNEPYIKPAITLIEKTQKGYIKMYKLCIVSKYVEDQIISNRDIIKETLLKDLLKLKSKYSI